jgi:hypothetical protein
MIVKTGQLWHFMTFLKLQGLIKHFSPLELLTLDISPDLLPEFHDWLLKNNYSKGEPCPTKNQNLNRKSPKPKP